VVVTGGDCPKRADWHVLVNVEPAGWAVRVGSLRQLWYGIVTVAAPGSTAETLKKVVTT
jgi:hypothetical protein